MKTANQTTGNFPRTGRFSLYICAVMVLCFFNWVALNAQIAKEENCLTGQPSLNMADADEPAIQLQDWMLNVDKGYLAGNEESELKVEPWMLSFNQDYMARAVDSEISFEPWMINFEQRCLFVEAEQEFPLEEWMVSTCTWECSTGLFAGK